MLMFYDLGKCKLAKQIRVVISISLSEDTTGYCKPLQITFSPTASYNCFCVCMQQITNYCTTYCKYNPWFTTAQGKESTYPAAATARAMHIKVNESFHRLRITERYTVHQLKHTRDMDHGH